MLISNNIIKKLKTNDPSLTEYSGDNVGTEGAIILAEAIAKNTFLKNLELGRNKIAPEGAKALAKALMTNNALENLYLRGNSIEDEGVQYLSQALAVNKTLRTLYLGGNNIGTKGAQTFAKFLAYKTKLQAIFFRNNPIGDDGVKALAEALKTNVTMLVLNIANTEMSDIGLEAMTEALKLNTTLKELIFDHNEKIKNTTLAEIINDRLAYNNSPTTSVANNIAKKFFKHCELYLDLKRNVSDQELAKDHLLTAMEQYSMSEKNHDGTAILVLAILSKMIKRYDDVTEQEKILKTLIFLHPGIFLRAKQELADNSIKKPYDGIVELAKQLLTISNSH